ncbi:MAG: PspC domain-containing protein [Bacteroidetes bacterium]|nr:PspC domain-containing protein [Bacteroidota bacterium]
MEKIVQINYQGRNISIEENAYNDFQQYENELKAYFLKEVGGEETFTDLQYRMGEILEQKNSSGTQPITQADINELINTIGKPSDLDDEQPSGEKYEQASTEKKRLYRNKYKQGKVIAGVCSGIANYFSIDPIAVRLVFVLFTIFNIATFFSFNLGILAYILLWIVLPSAYLKDNITRKLFRNPKDKVLGGVCSGIAQFFNTETWIIRLVFLAPFVLGIITNNSSFGGHDIHFISTSFYGITFISYLILWIIVPIAKSPTDFMLLKGEPINISTIQNPISMEKVTQNSNSGINKFLKVIAYIVIICFLLFMIPIAFGVLMGAFFSYNLADIILFSSLNKTLAIFTILFFILLPVVGIIIWLIRRIAGYTKPNRPLRVMFTGLNILGWVSLVLLVANLVKENNTYITKPTSQKFNVLTDTLYIQAIDPDSSSSEQVIFSGNALDQILHRTANDNEIRAVRIKYKRTKDSLFKVVIEKSAFGSKRLTASEHAEAARYEYRLDGNTLYLSAILAVSNKMPYHFQNVKVTIYVPENKAVHVSDNFRRQLKHSVMFNKKNFKYNVDDDENYDEDILVIDDTDEDELIIEDDVIRIKDQTNDITIRSDNAKEAKEILDDAEREAKLEIEAAQRELEETNRSVQQQLEESKRATQERIDEAKRKMEESKREAKRKLENR